MNKLELSMRDLLVELRERFNVTGVKAEFEAEGTRIEEALRLKDVTSSAGVGLSIKIGGCEAVKDMLDTVNLGARHIIAPMVETPYSLQKFIRAAQVVYKENLENTHLLVNIETITAYENFAAMLRIPEIKYLNGIVIGRVDFVGSMGWSRDDINSDHVLKYCLELAARAKDKDLEVVIGGGVSADSLPFFNAFPKGHLNRFETRKIIFQCPAALNNSAEAFAKAVEFELMWLKNKHQYYFNIANEDQERIQMMEARLRLTASKIKEEEKASS